MKIRNTFLWIIVLVSLIVPRFDRIERPITVDELTWLTFSADFYYGLGQREFEHTYQDHHPGVTTMWAGTGAYLLDFRGYRGQGQGYMENDTFKLIDFLEYHGVNIFDILVTARTLMAIASVLVLTLAFWFLWRLVGPIPSFTVMMFIALDPFVIGQSRLFSHEGLMSVLVLLTWLSFYHYIKAGRQWASLLISGLAAGAAVLTKITALGLLPLVGLLWLGDLLRENPKEKSARSSHFYSYLWPMLVWLLVLVVVFVTLWPATWSNPIGTVTYMIDHTRGFSGSTPSASFNLTGGLARVWDYIASIWAHTTLITWAGVLAFVLIAFSKKKKEQFKELIPLVSYTFHYDLVVILTVGLLVKNIQGARYMASVHTFLALTGGVGFWMLIEQVRELAPVRRYTWFAPVVLGVVLIGQVLTFLPAVPYYYVYEQPLKTNVWWEVHGAFLDQAGEYIAQKPNAEGLTVITFSPGSLMFFHPGETTLLIPKGGWGADDVRRLEAADYLVFNYEFRNLDSSPRIVHETEGVTPEHTIEFMGRTLVWIYRVVDLPPSAFIPD